MKTFAVGVPWRSRSDPEISEAEEVVVQEGCLVFYNRVRVPGQVARERVGVRAYAQGGWLSFEEIEPKPANLNLTSVHVPHRDSDVEAWIKKQRDHYQHPTTAPLPAHRSCKWDALDDLLDNYRLHADMGTSLDEEVPEG